ncbi:serine/threonine-protein kinase PLK1-like isoform X1 [Mercenaria mercenaria]|uniref:serine/threonine-protein kinase PLK1-like isoform X1 n=2 Tax=Mercenaria mercenaria TaxID=6596 RepID=UPI00234EA6DC|nr:serine/threonine-protein kinase PLK1-like isoform X1 [Mercenaria mercenaria]
MSVDILPAKVAQGPSFKYPHLTNMKEARLPNVAPMKRRDSKGVNISNFDPNCIIYNSNTDTTYLRGKLLGKGGFARCYEMLDLNSNIIYAGKIISKHRISKPHQRQKIMREVELQRNLKHRNVVEFHSFFEDEENVYIVLENCNRKSLVYMLKHRKTLTEPEVRYYMGQLVDGVKYIQEHDIIHRDLKLGNMLLNDDMDVKIADFGLATRVEFEGEKKMTVCGTPNYIAPEVLQKRGHSYEADTWALGCVMYALLVGHPPFETATLKETYIRITENRYSIPDWISPQARNLITKCLTNEPELRPSLNNILTDDFFTCGHFPNRLSPSCCTSPPRFPANSAGSFVRVSRPKSYAVPETRPESGVDRITSPIRELEITNKYEHHSKGRHTPDFSIPMSRISGRTSGSEATRSDRSDSPALRESSPKPRSAANLLDVLTTCLEHMPKDVIKNPEPMGDMTILWVSKWVDYSNKYGFGFQLSNDSIGVLFNDTSKIILSPDGRSVQYYDMTGHLNAFSVDQPPDDLDKKTTLLMYFAKYMDEHLIQGGNIECSKDSDDISVGSLCLKKWFRTAKAIVLYLNDGTLQVNFFDDHTKIILSYMRNDYFVTYIDEERCATTYSMVHLIQDGCQRDIMDRMSFARSMLKNLVDIEGVDI